MPTTPRPLPVLGGRALALVGIILVALNLRTAVAALSPIFDRINVDVPLDTVGIGLLGTLPPLCFAVFGLATPLLRRRMHLETLLLVSLAATTVAHLWRGSSDSFASLVLASVAAFAGAGVANVVLPPIVKKYFPNRIGGMTSAYVTVMTLFSMVPALIAVPVAESFGWRVSVGMWAALGAVAVFPWLALWLRERRAQLAVAEPDADVEVEAPALVGRVWRTRLGWALAVLFGMTSMNVFGAFAWMPQMLTEIAGVAPAQAGALLALFAAMGVPLGLIIPVLAVRPGSALPLIVAGVAFFIAGYAALLLVPDVATWLWVVLVGLGPLLFPLSLVMINLRTRTPQGAIALSGFTQGIGYLIGSLGPLLMGILYELTGSWTAPILFLLSTVVGTAVAGYVLLRPRMLEDEWHERADPPTATG
ncbi:MAG: MFS transporter [Homoserinimonas sp.]